MKKRRGTHGDLRCYQSGCRCAECRAANAAYARDYRKRTGRTRKDNLRNAHGLSLEEYDALFTEQAGVCAACGNAESGRNMYGIVSLSVDHDHATGVIRGLLCMRCNRALGLLRDSPKIIQELLTYRRRFGE